MPLPAYRKAIIKRKARHGTLRTMIRRQRLIRLSGEQNHQCCYCGQKTWHPEINDGGDVNQSRRRRATIEHIVPQTNGGGEGKHNLIMACAQCNNSRGELPLEDFVALISNDGVTPLSVRARRILKKERKRKSNKGKMKAIKTFRLIIIGALYYPVMFDKAIKEIKPSPPKTKRHRPLNSISSIKKRVIENQMVAIASTL